MLDGSLERPDALNWRDEPQYSPMVAKALRKAYSIIKGKNRQSGAYFEASLLLKPLRDTDMCIHQRMHIYFVFALGQAAYGSTEFALFWIDEALILAVALSEEGDQAELLFHRASLNRAALHLAEATADLRDCLALIDVYHAHHNTDGSADRLRVLPHLATYEYFITDFEMAEKHASESRKLALSIPNSTFEAASAEWVQANLYRLQRQPERALRPALQICEVYARESTPISYERAEIFVAQTALDFADVFSGSDRDALLMLAAPHLERAEQIARETDDRPGQGLTKLMRAYSARLSAENRDRAADIEDVIQLARKLEDIALLAQAYTALGDEYASQGQQEPALACYNTTVEVISRSELPVLALPARRALLAARE